MNIQRFCKKHRITQTQIAELLGITVGGANYKLRGLRPLKRDEINKILALCRGYDAAVGYEDLFGEVNDRAA